MALCVLSCCGCLCDEITQLSAMDVSAWTTMKGAAKCDNLCELQNSVNQKSFERVLCCWAIPDSMPALVPCVCVTSGSKHMHLILCVHATGV